MLKEFKSFVMRGNVLDLAVGVIIGAAFGKIVSSLVDDVLMPPIGKLIGKVDFSQRFINLSDQHDDQLPDSRASRVSSRAHGESLDDQTGGSHDEGLSTVRDEHSDPGEALRPLHLAARGIGAASISAGEKCWRLQRPRRGRRKINSRESRR